MTVIDFLLIFAAAVYIIGRPLAALIDAAMLRVERAEQQGRGKGRRGTLTVRKGFAR